jgi:threonine dehydrogenase-like Zn-dependent dehydrogenase
MRAVRIASGAPVLVDVDEPTGDGVMLEVASSSICGTDVGLVGMGLEGFTLGHEFAGWVDGVAYAVEPTIWCGSCPQCLDGHTQRCVGDHRNLGFFCDGGLSDRILVPSECLVALPSGLDVADACLVEPASVAWHGVQRAAIQAGERVVVVGGGSIGLLAVAAAHSRGHEVAIHARHPQQFAAAEALGARPLSGEYDVVIEAAGSESGLARCAELARPGGRVIVLGVYYGAVPVPGVATLVKELSWVGAMAYGRHDGHREVDAAAALLANEPAIASTLITHRFALDEAPEAFRVAADRVAGAIKVALHP